MTLDKPRISRAYVQVIDPTTRKGRCRTYYYTTVDDVFRILDSHAGKSESDAEPKQTHRRETVSA
jgi:hypothetical protein